MAGRKCRAWWAVVGWRAMTKRAKQGRASIEPGSFGASFRLARRPSSGAHSLHAHTWVSICRPPRSPRAAASRASWLRTPRRPLALVAGAGRWCWSPSVARPRGRTAEGCRRWHWHWLWLWHLQSSRACSSPATGAIRSHAVPSVLPEPHRASTPPAQPQAQPGPRRSRSRWPALRH